MAARRVRLRYLVVTVGLVLAAAAATTNLKHAVRELDRRLAETKAEIERARWAVQAARADLAYLTRPERLVMQAEQLGMVPAQGERVAEIDQILTHRELSFARTAMPAVLPSGAEVSLRGKPWPQAFLALVGGGDG